MLRCLGPREGGSADLTTCATRCDARLEIVEVGGRKVIGFVDCYNANPASMAAALRTLAERARGGVAIAVVGDMLELGDHARDAHREVGVLARELGLSVIADPYEYAPDR